jgi:hypothetical protein
MALVKPLNALPETAPPPAPPVPLSQVSEADANSRLEGTVATLPAIIRARQTLEELIFFRRMSKLTGIFLLTFFMHLFLIV